MCYCFEELYDPGYNAPGASCLLHNGFYMIYYSDLKMEVTRSTETSFDFVGLHGVISQTIELSIFNALRTLNNTTIPLCSS
jgi:hypothetical protein